MGFPIASGPNYSNRQIGATAASSRFIPEVWSSKLVEKFYDTTVLAAISNTDYEGEIQNYGDKVVIRTRPDITIYNYQKGMTLTYETPESTSTELVIDKGKAFSFTADDVDRVQSDLGLLDEWGSDASEQMKISIDTDVLGAMYGSVAAANTGATAGRISQNINLGATGSPIALDKTNILDYIVDLGTVLDEQNVPESGRWLTLPAWACGLIKKSDLKDASLSGDGTSILRNGRMGMIDRFTLYNTNLLATTVDGVNTVFNIMAGHKSGLTFATQMTKMETLRNPDKFGDLVRGLQVFGYKVIKPESIAHLYARKA